LLKKTGEFDVKVVLTSSAQRFIGPAALEALAGTQVLSSLWSEGEVMEHIDLGRWADLMVVYPATANLINSWAAGLAADLVGSLYLAFPQDKPVLIAPAMNTRMWGHPATVNSVNILSKRGVQFVAPEEGQLACGEVGAGRLSEPEQMLESIVDASRSVKMSPQVGHQVETPAQKVLVVYGGTKAPIDEVRSITNTSSGRTGAELSDRFLTEGLDVTILRAKSAFTPLAGAQVKTHEFVTYQDLRDQLKSVLASQAFDAVVQLAAVSDYTVESQSKGKLSAEGELILKLVPTEKLVNQVKAWSSNEPAVFAFKLTVGASSPQVKAAVEKVFAAGGVDYVVQNDLRFLSEGRHPYSVFSSETVLLGEGQSVSDLARSLLNLIERGQDSVRQSKEFSI
jgi:phosphopantothenoylcysteine decarboxylase/phosphopantothenate--cysteine ligase